MVTDETNEALARERSQAGAERFLPATEGTRPVRDLPVGYGLESGGDLPKKYVSVDEAEVGEAGGTAEYMEMHHPADLAGELSDENIERLKEDWLKVYGEPCPYEFDDIHDREIYYEMAVNELVDGWKIDLSERDEDGNEKVDVVDVSFDWRGLRNEATRAFLKRKGDEAFVEKIWGGCTKISLCEPVEGEGGGWKIIIERGGRDKRDFMIISKSDFEDSLMNKDGRSIELPGLGNGGREARVRFIECLHKLRIGGVAMPPVVNVDVRMGVTFPKRKERKPVS